MLKFDAAAAEDIGRGEGREACSPPRRPRPLHPLLRLCSEKDVLGFVWSGIAAKNYFFSFRIRSFGMSYMLRGEERRYWGTEGEVGAVAPPSPVFVGPRLLLITDYCPFRHAFLFFSERIQFCVRS